MIKHFAMDSKKFQSIKEYVDFDDASSRALATFAPLAKAAFPAIVEDFYEAIRRSTNARKVIVGGDAQVQRLKSSLVAWLGELLSGPFDDAYLVAHSRIGRVHVRIGLSQELMLTAMNRIRLGLLSVAQSRISDPRTLQDTVAALHRVLDLELAIMLDTYRFDWLERVRLEERLVGLLESERFSREVIDGLPAFVVALDDLGSIVLWNRTLETVTGYPKEEMIGQPGADFVQSNEPQRLAVKDGEGRIVRWRLAATAYVPGAERNSKRRLTFAFGVDVTEELRTLRRHRRAERLAAVGTMAAGLAHEVRNPLNSASLQLALLQRRLRKNEIEPQRIASAVGLVEGEIRRLDGLVTDFLAFARPKPTDWVATELTSLVAETVAFFSHEAEEAGVHLSAELAQGPLVLMLDSGRIKQALVNLIRNAIQATPAGGTVVIRLSLSEKNAVDIAIEDSGPGFSNDAPIFDAFYTTKDGGTGLGLALVHAVAHEHGGTVNAHSEPGRTQFLFRLPHSPVGELLGAIE